MNKIGIVVADGSRARFLTLALFEKPLPGRDTYCVEHPDLINPEGTPPALENLFQSEAAPRADAQRRRQHDFLRRFARRMIEEIRLFIVDQSLEQLISWRNLTCSVSRAGSQTSR